MALTNMDLNITSGIVSPLFIGDISILHFRGHFYFALT
ncbi:hypothetical protein ATHL_00863, partial [Anaerolinea thermolimosa]